MLMLSEGSYRDCIIMISRILMLQYTVGHNKDQIQYFDAMKVGGRYQTQLSWLTMNVEL